MDLPSHAEVVDRIDAFLARHKMAPSRLGRDAIGEPQFVSSVKGGRKPGLETLRKLLDFMRERDEAALSTMGGSSSATETMPHRLNAAAR